MVIDWVALIINMIVSIIILSPVLWLSGRGIVGKEKAKFTDAVLIIIIGTVVGTLFGALVQTFFGTLSGYTGIIVSIIQLILWLLIVKHFFDCGWLQALAVSIVAIIIFIIIAVLLGLLGFVLFSFI
ncbi:MAG: hypothetical protein L6N94_01590 [Candidatus Methylarchaceae archaeon HK01M]|nr:hypothetical protein [Candidatus Methylarchaceae archaeon HK01M]